jgi:hypothetical protein
MAETLLYDRREVRGMKCPACGKKTMRIADHPHALGHKDSSRAECWSCGKRFKKKPKPEPKAAEMFEVREVWRVVDKDGKQVGQTIVLEYLNADDAFDSDHDATEVALSRLGLRVECLESNAPEGV